MSKIDQPLVSVICTCFNHERFIAEAIDSVFNQTYPKLELVVIDDRSSDHSVQVIESSMANYGKGQFIRNRENRGICRNFNEGINRTNGKYLIDLSGDDLLAPDRVEEQVTFFEQLPREYGVLFSNALMINEHGEAIKHFYPINEKSKAKKRPPDEDVYQKLIDTYFIAAPTMMIKRDVLLDLGGYDEELAYEDYDFWIRSSRNWKYKYLDKVLTSIRDTRDSLSSRQYEADDRQLRSTYKVCEKIKELNRNKEEDLALIRRLKYEIKHAVLADKKVEAEMFLRLLTEFQPLNSFETFLNGLNKSGIKTAWLRKRLIKLNS